MPRTSNPLTITIPKGMSRRIRREADKRNMTVSGLLRTSFEAFVKESPDIYTDKELAALLQRDRISTKLQKDLDMLLGR